MEWAKNKPKRKVKIYNIICTLKQHLSLWRLICSVLVRSKVACIHGAPRSAWYMVNVEVDGGVDNDICCVCDEASLRNSGVILKVRKKKVERN